MTPDADVVACADLSLARAGVRVVDGVDLMIDAGTAAAVMGPTGAGKSTLLAMLAGRAGAGVAVLGGRATVCGVDVRRRGRGGRPLLFHAGYLPQGAGAALPSRLTVAEIVGEPITSRDRRVNPRALAVRVAGLLDELELSLGTAQKYPYELSSGMRQRVALAQALVLDPRLVVADDPYANLDPDVRLAVRDVLRRRRDAGAAVLVALNDDAAVRDLDAQAVVLRAGRPVAYGRRVDEMLWTPDARAAV